MENKEMEYQFYTSIEGIKYRCIQVTVKSVLGFENFNSIENKNNIYNRNSEEQIWFCKNNDNEKIYILDEIQFRDNFISPNHLKIKKMYSINEEIGYTVITVDNILDYVNKKISIITCDEMTISGYVQIRKVFCSLKCQACPHPYYAYITYKNGNNKEKQLFICKLK